MTIALVFVSYVKLFLQKLSILQVKILDLMLVIKLCDVLYDFHSSAKV